MKLLKVEGSGKPGGRLSSSSSSSSASALFSPSSGAAAGVGLSPDTGSVSVRSGSGTRFSFDGGASLFPIDISLMSFFSVGFIASVVCPSPSAGCTPTIQVS